MKDWQKLKNKKLTLPPTLEETRNNLLNSEYSKIYGRILRRTGRTEQFATRVTKEWLINFKNLAIKQRLKLAELLEDMLELYEKELAKGKKLR